MKVNSYHLCRVAGRLMFVAIVVVGFAAWLSIAVGAETRTWTDKTGKFKIEAKFVELADGKVTLQREDGSRVSIPLEKLREEDQKAATESGEQDPFQAVKPATKKEAAATDGEDEEPVKKPAKKKKAVEQDESEEEGEVSGEPKLVAPKWSGAKEILASPSQEKWSISIEAPEKPEAAKKGRPIATPAKTDFFERLNNMAVNPVCGRAVLGYALDRPGGGAARPFAPSARGGRGGRAAVGAVGGPAGAQSRLVLCDLQSGKTLGQVVGPGKMSLLALSDDSKKVLMRREEFGFGNLDRLEIWSFTKSGINRELQWTPHDQEKGPARDINWAQFIDEERVATVSGGGLLTIWRAATAKPLVFMKIQGNCCPALSPDRKYLAFATDKGIGMLDLAAGEVVAMQAAPREHFPFPVMAFTPSGKRLACAAFDRVYVWDVSTGALYRDISLEGAKLHIGNHLICPSENHVLAGNSLLLDIESQARVWTYQGVEAVQMFRGVCWFAVSSHQSPGVLVPATLPHPAAKEQIQKAVQSADFFVLKPGTIVNVNVTALQDPAEREKVGAALARKLQANGLQVGPNGTIELAASCEMGKRREVSYHTFGRFGDKNYNVQDYISRLKFVYQGQIAWEAVCGSVPGFVQLNQGETMEQVLQRSERPNYAWFATAELPKWLQKPSPDGATLGASQVTAAGVR